MTNQEKKAIHNRNLFLLGALAVEHAVQFLPSDSAVRKVVEERIAAVREGTSHELVSRIKCAQKKIRTPRLFVSSSTETKLMNVSEKLILFANCGGKYLSGAMLRNILVPAWDALPYRNGDNPQIAETKWQDSVIHPLVEQAFKHFGEPLAVEELEALKK